MANPAIACVRISQKQRPRHTERTQKKASLAPGVQSVGSYTLLRLENELPLTGINTALRELFDVHTFQAVSFVVEQNAGRLHSRQEKQPCCRGPPASEIKVLPKFQKNGRSAGWQRKKNILLIYGVPRWR